MESILPSRTQVIVVLNFFNYKHFFSVLILALVDANYKFIYVDEGFNNSFLRCALTDWSFNLPPPVNTEGIPGPNINYHIVGDVVFSLTKNLMKPYPHGHLDKPKRIFNYWISCTIWVAKNVFGILANRFHVFSTRIKLNPGRVTYVILASCCLHNYMVENNKHTYTNADHTFSDGAWRSNPSLNH